ALEVLVELGALKIGEVEVVGILGDPVLDQLEGDLAPELAPPGKERGDRAEAGDASVGRARIDHVGEAARVCLEAHADGVVGAGEAAEGALVADPHALEGLRAAAAGALAVDEEGLVD